MAEHHGGTHDFNGVIASTLLDIPVYTADGDAPNRCLYYNSNDSAFKYKDQNGNVVSTSGQLTDEQVQDKVAAFIAGGDNVTADYDDPNDTLTVNGLTDAEVAALAPVQSVATKTGDVSLVYGDIGNTHDNADHSETYITSADALDNLDKDTADPTKYFVEDGNPDQWNTFLNKTAGNEVFVYFISGIANSNWGLRITWDDGTTEVFGAPDTTDGEFEGAASGAVMALSYLSGVRQVEAQHESGSLGMIIEADG